MGMCASTGEAVPAGPHTVGPPPPLTGLCSRALPASVSPGSGVGGTARVWPSLEKQPCTDGGAAGCTVVGPPSSGEHGCARFKAALTTFLSWQPCTLSSSLVQAKWLCSSFPQPRGKLGYSIRPVPLHTFHLFQPFHKVFSRFTASFLSMDFSLGYMNTVSLFSQYWDYCKNIPNKNCQLLQTHK